MEGRVLDWPTSVTIDTADSSDRRFLIQRMKRIRVFLADDNTLWRAGLRSFLEKYPSIDIVGENGTGRELFRRIRANCPEVLLMELETTGDRELRTIRRTARQFPKLGIVVFSVAASPSFVARALRAGVRGHLLKQSRAEELRPAIEAAARGNQYVCPLIASQLGKAQPDRVRTKPSPTAELTRRQRQILRFIARGLSTKEIAGETRLSVKTVAFHRGLLMKRLKIHHVPGLVRYAIRAGLISP